MTLSESLFMIIESGLDYFIQQPNNFCLEWNEAGMEIWLFSVANGYITVSVGYIICPV